MYRSTTVIIRSHKPLRSVMDHRGSGRGVPSTPDPATAPFGRLRRKPGTGGQVVETHGEWETSVGGAADNTLYQEIPADSARR